MKIMRYEHFDICNFEFEKNVRKEKKYYFLKINNYLKLNLTVTWFYF